MIGQKPASQAQLREGEFCLRNDVAQPSDPVQRASGKAGAPRWIYEVPDFSPTNNAEKAQFPKASEMLSTCFDAISPESSGMRRSWWLSTDGTKEPPPSPARDHWPVKPDDEKNLISVT